MAEQKELQRRPTAEMARAAEERFRMPPVDIYETDESIVLLADMPGVSDKNIEVSVEEDTLSIIGRVDAPPPTGARAVYQEYESAPFRRMFVLSDEIRRDGIEGKMQNGVLRLTLPKAEEAKVRKIQIKAQ